MADINEEHFWSKVTIGDDDECWPFTGSNRGHGYGGYQVGRRWRSAHSVALELTLGRPLGLGMIACHTCDFRKCCNPAHLWEGTHKDNHQDKSAKGRWYGGEWNDARRKKTGDAHRARKRRKCEYCDMVAEGSGMSSHMRARHPEKL